MNPHHRPFSPHRIARLIAWAQAMLAWAALVLFAPPARVSRRHIRQRYDLLSLDWAEHLVRSLAIIRARELAHLRAPMARRWCASASAGFRRRRGFTGIQRAAAGSRFRKALKHRDLATRLQRIIAALADIDAFTRRYLVARAKRRLTRLAPLLIAAPPADALVCLAAPAPCAADSS